MDIGFGDLRQLEIDDMGHAVDVDAARGDVGRDQGARLAAAEGGKRALALALALVAMDGGGVDAGLVERLGDAVGAALGAGEDDDARHRRVVEQLDQHVALRRGPSTKMTLLLDAVGGLGGRRHRDLDRIVQQLAGERPDVRRHGRREEQVLPLLRQFAHDVADRLDEAEIEHLVDLVEHEELDVAPRLRDAGVQVVEQTAGRGDQHIETARQRA